MKNGHTTRFKKIPGNFMEQTKEPRLFINTTTRPLVFPQAMKGNPGCVFTTDWTDAM